MNIDTLCTTGIQEWKQIKALDTLEKYYVEEAQKQKNETEFQRLFETMMPYMDNFPKQKQAQKLWKKKGQKFLEDFMAKDDVFLVSGMDEHVSKLFQDITMSFLKDARKFDASLSLEDIGQAMRNVWIVVILQCIFQKPVGYHKAMFAYSMLYPYSDNYLDDVNVPKAEKKQFNQWFSNRLQGLPVEIHNPHEDKISQLVGMIEEVFDRTQYPRVYESLMMIQNAQILSLSQQDGEAVKTQQELEYISYRKGGSSVVADGFLIDGDLSEAQIMFCMRYGFMLQIGDDLQDMEEDRRYHHQTLLYRNDADVDQIFYQLVQYTEEILRPQRVCEDEKLLRFVLEDCLFLLFLSIYNGCSLVRETTYQEALKCLCVRPAFMEAMKQRPMKKFNDEELWERIDCFLAEA